MSANALHFWMSARETGSWQQFRAAIERLHMGTPSEGGSPLAGDTREFPLHQQLRFNLERLGHAEFFAEGTVLRWRIAPPVLVINQRDGSWVGVAAGARTAELMRRLAASPIALSVESQAACPDIQLVRSESHDDLTSLAASVGMFVQHDAPAAILACVSAIDDNTLRATIELPVGIGWTIERFCTRELRWLAAERSEVTIATGQLFRFSFQHVRHVMFCSGGDASSIDSASGKYLALRRARRNVLAYDRQTGRLTTPSGCRPPALIERALALCSGRPPSFEVASGRGVVHYEDVGPAVATTAAWLLRQEIRH